MAIIIPANSAADTGYDVANSCRFNPGDSPELSRSTGDGNEDIGSFSFWWKPAKAPGGAVFYNVYVDSNNFFDISCDGDGNFQVRNKLSGSYNMQFESSATYRDPSAWYNFIVLVDTTQAVEANRMKAYVNGTQITAWQTDTYPSQNTDMIMNSNSRTARISPSQDRVHGYLAEFVLIDGTAKVVGDFGEFDEDSPTIWKPKDVSTLSGDKGVNGFYLDFEDSSALGNCAFGGTDFTASNLAAADQAVDSPTNNFSVLNPLMNKTAAYTFSEGNCKVVTTSSGTTGHYACSTIAPSKGKWYFEMKVASSSGYDDIGLVQDSADNFYSIVSTNNGIGYNSAQEVYRGSDRTGDAGGTFNTFTTNDIIGCYVDLDNHEFYVAKNGTIENSGTGITITTTSTTDHGVWFLAVGDQVNSAAATLEVNFGGCSAFTVSSANSDANGYGNFEYDPSSGTFDGASKNFLALCTKNLAEDG